MAVKEDVYTDKKGNSHPTLTFAADTKYPFSLGVRKLAEIMNHQKEIKEFLAKHSQESEG